MRINTQKQYVLFYNKNILLNFCRLSSCRQTTNVFSGLHKSCRCQALLLASSPAAGTRRCWLPVQPTIRYTSPALAGPLSSCGPTPNVFALFRRSWRCLASSSVSLPLPKRVGEPPARATESITVYGRSAFLVWTTHQCVHRV